MGDSKRSSYTEFPAWVAIEAFEKILNEWLEKIAAARRGGFVVEEFIPTDGVAEKGIRAVTKFPCDYSPAVCRLIDDAWSAISRSEVGEWIARERRKELDDVLTDLRQKCDMDFEAPSESAKISLNERDIRAIRQTMVKERDLRFFGDLALIWGRVKWHRWIPCNTSIAKIDRFAAVAADLRRALDQIAGDRFVRRRLSAQELNAVSLLGETAQGLQLSLGMVSDVQPLQPYARFHADGRGVRSEVAAELVFLCDLCFGECPRAVLIDLLNRLEIDLPAKLDVWVADQLEVGRKIANSYAAAQHGINVLLPPQEKSDTRQTGRSLPPWRRADVSLLVLDGYASGLGV